MLMKKKSKNKITNLIDMEILIPQGMTQSTEIQKYLKFLGYDKSLLSNVSDYYIDGKWIGIIDINIKNEFLSILKEREKK